MMNEGQARIAIPLLNSYAHQYLGMPHNSIGIGGGRDPQRGWVLIVVGDHWDEGQEAKDFDEAKALIDTAAQAKFPSKMGVTIQ